MLIFVVLFRGSLFTNNTHPQIFLAYLSSMNCVGKIRRFVAKNFWISLLIVSIYLLFNISREYRKV